MCYRLLAAVHLPAGVAPTGVEPLQALAVAHGLDVRAHEAGAALGYLEIAWGDCACSLYTRKDGRERVVAFVEALAAKALAPQLLLFNDGDALALQGPPATVPLGDFLRRGLQALPEGQVALLTRD